MNIFGLLELAALGDQKVMVMIKECVEHSPRCSWSGKSAWLLARKQPQVRN